MYRGTRTLHRSCNASPMLRNVELRRDIMRLALRMFTTCTSSALKWSAPSNVPDFLIVKLLRHAVIQDTKPGILNVKTYHSAAGIFSYHQML